VSFNKVFAKLGSDLKKPDAVTVISRENFRYVVWPLPVEEMIYVGHSTAEKLAKLNIYTIGDLAAASADLIQRKFGKVGLKLRESARGEDTEPVKCYTDQHIPKSIGNGTTTPADVTNLGDAASVIFALCEMIGFRLRRAQMVAEGVAVNLRSVQLDSFSRQCRLPMATDAAYNLATAALELVKANYDFTHQPPLRTITVSAFGLRPAGNYVQTTLFDEDPGKNTRLEERVDVLRKKYGFGVLRRGVNLDTIFTCDDREAEDEFLPFDKHMKNFNQ
jgi:DNA polymerase-4